MLYRIGTCAAMAAIIFAAACAPASTPHTPPVPDATLAPGLRTGSHEVQLNGARLAYRVAGPAVPGVPPVVFLHGGPGQGSTHFEVLSGPFMERELRMVYLDQRGSGHSERPASGDYALATLVEDIEALRQHLGVPRIALVGHSFGGLLALEYGRKYPDRVSHLVFVAGLWDTPMQCELRAERFAELRPEAYARLRADTASGRQAPSGCGVEFSGLSGAGRERYQIESMFPDPGVAARMDSVNEAHGVRNTGELSRSLFSGGLLTYQFTEHARLTMPVLVIAGAHDGAARPQGLRELARRLPNAQFVEFERSGHFVYLDEPDRFATEVARFIRAR